jgi:hypothetical protein
VVDAGVVHAFCGHAFGIKNPPLIGISIADTRRLKRCYVSGVRPPEVSGKISIRGFGQIATNRVVRFQLLETILEALDEEARHEAMPVNGRLKVVPT